MYRDTLCWSCANACGGCEWSQKKAKPVPGWTAEKTKIRLDKGKTMDSYFVTECPKYRPDGSEKLKQRKKSARKVTDDEIDYILQERDKGRTYVEIGRKLDLPKETVRDNYIRHKTRKTLENMQ